MSSAEGRGQRARGTGQRASDDDLDRVVDNVAREMTAGEPDSALKARVLARIERGESVRRTWRPAWIIAPLAAAAMAIVVVMVSRSANETPGPYGPGTRTVRLQPDTTTENREP